MSKKVAVGKKRKLDDFGDDLDLFTYGNQMPLTFSVPTSKAAVNIDDSDSSGADGSDTEQTWERTNDDEEDRDQDAVGVDLEDSDEEDRYVNEEVDTLDLNESQGSRNRSPSPPPPLPQAALLKLQAQMQKKKSAREFDQAFDALKQAFTSEESPVFTRTINRSSGSVISLESPSYSITERERTLKIRTRSGIRKFDMKGSDKFEKIIKELAASEGVPESNILLSFKDRNVTHEDTPLQVGATVADIIECVVMESKTLNPEEDEDAIEIKISGGSAATSKSFKVYKDQPLETLIGRYCEFRKLPRSKLKFSFDGDAISGSETPEQLDIENEDMIEAKSI